MRNTQLFATGIIPTALPSSPARLEVLKTEHDDLDAAIGALALSGARDDLTISRLKKRKLHLKDEIAAILATAMGVARAPAW